MYLLFCPCAGPVSLKQQQPSHFQEGGGKSLMASQSCDRRMVRGSVAARTSALWRQTSLIYNLGQLTCSFLCPLHADSVCVSVHVCACVLESRSSTDTVQEVDEPQERDSTADVTCHLLLITPSQLESSSDYQTKLASAPLMASLHHQSLEEAMSPGNTMKGSSQSWGV